MDLYFPMTDLVACKPFEGKSFSQGSKWDGELKKKGTNSAATGEELDGFDVRMP